MDPVSRLLTERERRPPPLLPFVVLAIGLHAGAAAGIWIAGRAGSHLPAHLPSVSVRLVRPQEMAPASPRSSPARAAQQPRTRPTAPPQVEPKPPEPPPDAARPRASDTAMAAPQARSTPAPPPPSDTQGGATRGLSLGASAGMPGIPLDFQFTYYVERMLALIESRWYKPPVTGTPRARVRFTIARSGRVDGIRLEQSSGLPSYDRAALRALYAANPLPPLPPAYPKATLTVHLTFSE
jgi:TonB family protein